MEANDGGGSRENMLNQRDLPSERRMLSAQNLDPGVCSTKYPRALDIDDEYFAQDGFSYTGFLQDAIAYHPECGLMTNQEHNPQSASTFMEVTNNNPWDVNMFNDIELDKIYIEETTSNNQKGSNLNATRNSEGNNESGVCNRQASHTRNDATSDIDCSNADDTTKNLTEQDVENFLSNDKLTEEQSDQTPSEDINDFKPEVGMQFKTREEVQKFFNMYSYAVGFSVCSTSVYRTASKKRNNEVIRFTMKCNKYGRHNESTNENDVPQRQSTVIAKTNCRAEMVAAERNGVWQITGLNLLHNHELCPQSRFFRSHIYMSDGEKEMIRTMKNCNMPTRDMVVVLAFIRGGMTQLPYNKRKISNYSASINREVSNNDMMEVWEWFCKKKIENPGFYFSIQYDKDRKVRCVFWSDAKARLYYETCGDCISFDTTFLTNSYNLPFAPFVGVSPHGHTYLFACAFIVNEQACTFKWLFEKFLHAMGGKHPISIITDADKAMENAIPQVFPNATHRGCLFHIKKKIDDKGGTVFAANQGLYEEMQDIIDKSLIVHEFETLWQAMINEHNVEHIKVFQDLWKTRERWVPVYFKSNFFPFIQTTPRSEGTNALFKRGVGAQFSMTSFLREYQRFMDTIHSREDECDHNVINKEVKPEKFRTLYYIERQAHELYNLSIFRKFQQVLRDVTRLELNEEEKRKKYWVFQATNYPVREHRPRSYLVQMNEEAQEYSCICCKFEKDGLLCSHILKVMLHIQIAAIPDHYIIDRWRKKENKIFKITHIVLPADEESTVLRFNVLSRMMGHTVSETSKNKRKYKFMLQEIPRLNESLAKIDDEAEEVSAVGQNSSTQTVINPDRTGDNASSLRFENPDVVDRKGRPRLKTIKERIKDNEFYKCSHYGSNKHTIKKCVNKHLQFDLPKKRRTRKKKEGDEGASTNKKKTPVSGKKPTEAHNQTGKDATPPVIHQHGINGNVAATT